MPQVVRAALVDRCRLERRVPVPLPPAVQLDPAALRSGEDERRVQTRRQLLERLEGARTQRDTSARANRLRVGRRDATGIAALDGDGLPCAIEVASLERDPLVRA